jgi:hypothetical protein
MDLKSYNIINKSQENFSDIEKKFFRQDFVGRDNKEAIFAELNKVFSVIEIDEIAQYRETYWKLYVHACWDLINIHDEDFVTVMCERQIFDAFRLGFDVWEELISFINLFELTEESRKNTYKQFKYAFFNSEMVVSSDGKKIKEIISELTRIYRQGDNPIENAKYATYLGEIMFPKGKLYSEWSIVDSKEQQVKGFIGLIHFFLGVEEKDISIVLDSYSNSLSPNTQDATEKIANQTTSPPQQITETQKIIPEPKPTPISTIPEKPEQKEKTKPTNQVSSLSKGEAGSGSVAEKVISIHKIKEQVQSKFDVKNINDVEGIMTLLNKLADEYGDDRIRDLFYFDEEVGEFKWRQ